MKRTFSLLAIFFLLANTSLPVWAEEAPTVNSSSTEQTSQLSSDEPENIQPVSETELEVEPSSVNTETANEEPTLESTEDTVETEQDVQETPRMTPLATAGAGTEESPYLVTSFKELTDTLEETVAAGQTQYIQLQNDIVYDTTGIPIIQNTVIDGNGNALLYNGTRYSVAHFKSDADNINVTYKNVSFGNSTYPNSSWYGILYAGTKTGNQLTVENINYNIQNGSQPFWGGNNTGNTLTLKGKNTFHSSGTENGGEFVEGYRYVTFAENSDTTIYNDAPGATAVFYSSSQTVTIEKNASVSIESSKAHLFYNSATLNVQEQGKFSYKTIYGTNDKSNTANLCTGTLTANFAADSIGHFTTDVNNFTGTNPTFNLNSPDYVVIDSTSSSKRVLGDMKPIFKRQDSDTFSYRIDYLSGDKQQTYVPTVSTGSSYTITSSNIGDGYSVAYAKLPTIDSLSASSATGPDISSITAQIDSTSPANLLSSEIQYKLATKQLYSGELASADAQNSIQNAGTAEGVKETANVPLPGTQPPAGESSKYLFTKLPAGSYYLYVQVNDQRIAGYTFESLWQETSAEVEPFVLTQFSSNAMSFNSPIPGQFGKQQNLENYTIRNAGNVPAKISLTSITRNSDSSEKLSLVEQFDTNNQELLLSLIAEKVGSGARITFGPLTDKDPLNLDTLQLDPFWETDAQANLYLAGDYSGPMIGPQNFSYRFSFAISAVTTN